MRRVVARARDAALARGRVALGHGVVFAAFRSAPTFAAWEAFAGSDPFTAEPSVQFYVPTTSVAADHAPCVCVAAFLAALDFVPRGC